MASWIVGVRISSASTVPTSYLSRGGRTVSLGGVAVALAPHGLKGEAVQSELAAKLLDMNVHRAFLDHGPKDPLNQLSTAEDAARLAQQGTSRRNWEGVTATSRRPKRTADRPGTRTNSDSGGKDVTYANHVNGGAEQERDLTAAE
jgi:hypothetical protein